MEYKKIRKLAELMKEMDLSVLEVSEEPSVVRIERGGKPVSLPSTAPGLSDINYQPEPAAVPSKTGNDPHTITSPIVGVFYAAPSPDMKPYVSVGDAVHAGDVLCIIEAMKMMNEITAEIDGVITEICVGNKQVVEYGHPLFRVQIAAS